MFSVRWQHSIICMIALALRNSVWIPTAAITQACHYLSNTVKVKSTKQGPEWTRLCTEELRTYKWRCVEKEKLYSWEKNNNTLVGFLINFLVSAAKAGCVCDIFEWLYGGVWQMQKGLKRWGQDKQMGTETDDVLRKVVRLNSVRRSP